MTSEPSKSCWPTGRWQHGLSLHSSIHAGCVGHCALGEGTTGFDYLCLAGSGEMILPVAKMEEFPSLIDLATRRTASFEAVHNADPGEHCDGRQAAQLALQRPLAIGGARK